MYGARPEFTILQEPGVLVTSARFVVGQQTYPIANLTAVAPFTIPGSVLGNVIGAIALAGLGGAFVVANMTSSGTSIGYLIGGPILALAVGVFALGLTKKSMHGVRIATAGMQTQALFSRDLQHVQRVVAALNQALSMR